MFSHCSYLEMRLEETTVKCCWQLGLSFHHSFTVNETSYQELDYRGLKMRVLAPENIQQFLRKTESFSVSGHPSKGEGVILYWKIKTNA